MSPFLRHPHLIYGEGSQGFILRLANANGLDRAGLKGNAFFFHDEVLRRYHCLPKKEEDTSLAEYALRVTQICEQTPQIWNVGRCRCCPQCLREKAFWRIGWEHYFFDVCPIHHCWLIDSCDHCGAPITWRRRDLLQCDCGYFYASSRASEAPVSSISLARGLMAKISQPDAACALPSFNGLNLEQSLRLIRLLGSYGQAQISQMPQKIQNVGSMDVSWQITSTAAEIMSQWPGSFERILHTMLDRTGESAGQRFPRRFGFFYSLLYRRFADVEFAHLRAAFENFVAAHWHGPIAKRNKRLSASMLERATWIPANHARQKLQVSSSRLAELVRSGAIVGEQRISGSGRRFLVVHKDSIKALLPQLTDEVDLSTASEMLGLTRARLRSVLPQLFPQARKIEGDANRWAISSVSVTEFLRACDAPTITQLDECQVSMDHILRFWCVSKTEVAVLLNAVGNGSLKPIGVTRSGIGVSGAVFNTTQARCFIKADRKEQRDRWTIPEISYMLAVKQEVAYFLVRNGLLQSTSQVVGRRDVCIVDREALTRFRAHYIFARDLAKLINTSSRSLQAKLAALDVRPVESPRLEICRQLIFEKTPLLMALFPTLANQHITT